MSIADTLRAVPLFSHLRGEDVDRLASTVRQRAYPKKSIIVFEADPGDALFIIASGRVKVVLTAEDGREVILSTRGGGDFFGEMALFDNEPRSAHVIAMEDSELLILHREAFHKCIENIPGIAIGILRALVNRLREADNLIGGLVLLDVPGRLAQLILRMASEKDGQWSLEGMTHETMAQMVGSTRETVSRTIRNFVDQGVVEGTRKKITIKNRGELELLAGLRPIVPAEKVKPALQLGRRSTDS